MAPKIEEEKKYTQKDYDVFYGKKNLVKNVPRSLKFNDSSKEFETTHDFIWTMTEEPHYSRRLEILKKYPEIKKLFGHEPLTKYICVGIVFIQLFFAWYFRDINSYKTPLFWVVLYFVGATANQSIFLAIHEISHNLAFKAPIANKLFSILVCNIPIAVPYAASFKPYHMDHHRFQGVDGVDTDLPTTIEGRLLSSTPGKAFFALFQIFFYAIRPMAIKQYPFTRYHVLNLTYILGVDYLIYKYLGDGSFGVLVYLLASTVMAGCGLHPCAAHFIAEHFVFTGEAETYSYYGILNFFCWNVGYHNEHHDFPFVAWSKLPEIRRIAAEYYDTLPYHESWPMVTFQFVFGKNYSVWNRVKRKEKISHNNAFFQKMDEPSVTTETNTKSGSSPFHVVAESRRRLVAAGFTEIKERQNFDQKLARNGKYFYTRNQSALIAFSVGGKYSRGNGFSIVGAHTDSPCLKVKPISKKTKSTYLQVGVEVYGGGLWHTWFDRDLSVAGRVMVKNGDKFEQNLVKINKSILRIPNLAIHLTDRKDGFTFNKEVQLTPILGLTKAVEKQLNAEPTEGDGNTPKHHPEFLKLIANELKVNVEQIEEFELCLYDTQAPAVGGLNDEFVFSARLDNLGMSYCSLQGLINAKNLESDSNIRMVALFDNEEIGSVSTAGADSNLLEAALKRISKMDFNDGQTSLSQDLEEWDIVADFNHILNLNLISSSSQSVAEEALLKSMLISADMAHGLHPNYMEKHEDNHRPTINKGVVIKQNANIRYATNAISTLALREVARKRNVPLQEFVVRNDSPCGSTIGPMLSAKLGIRTVDVGNPQWAMHSIRECCGTEDVKYAIDLFEV
ncbi:hypothetical protein HK099_006427 [Clydaea vesicula]|uniref:Sphingolipid delta4-desaturase N-terminal domain-containing protein n=1 Tax=Clydaea vesicula TaxID=447962 RepID=A0AAD5XY88_9FUNG|nr:hypothetical protein HK099_006427 [Clydaea vesicula]